MRSKLRILGTGASASSLRHVPSAQVFNIGTKYYMVDCGETASLWLSRFDIDICKLSKIFITHLHADHFLGLPGIIYTMDLLGARHLQVYGPKGLKQAICPMLSLGNHKFRLDLELIELQDGVSEIVSKDDRLTVYSLPLVHSVPCIGYKFLQTDAGLELPDKYISMHMLTDSQVERIESGKDFEKLQSSQVCRQHNRFSYAYLCDTSYRPELVPLISHCDVVFHETSFLQKQANRAAKTLHSTTRQAGEIAEAANAGTLIIGHYSRRYCSRSHILGFLEQTKEVFPYTIAASEGMSFDLRKGRYTRYSFPSKLQELLIG